MGAQRSRDGATGSRDHSGMQDEGGLALFRRRAGSLWGKGGEKALGETLRIQMFRNASVDASPTAAPGRRVPHVVSVPKRGYVFLCRSQKIRHIRTPPSVMRARDGAERRHACAMPTKCA